MHYPIRSKLAQRGQNHTIDQKGHHPMAIVEEFNRTLIDNYLRAKGFRYLRDPDGNFCVFLSLHDVDYELRAWFEAVGSQEDVYSVAVHSSKRYPKSEWSRCLMLCNTWNRERWWPKAYLNVSDLDADTSGDIRLEGAIELEEGIHQELFEQFTDTIITSALQFWQWEKQQGP